MARIKNWNAELRTWLSPFLGKLGGMRARNPTRGGGHCPRFRTEGNFGSPGLAGASYNPASKRWVADEVVQTQGQSAAICRSEKDR
jgi:hypothetical protein